MNLEELLAKHEEKKQGSSRSSANHLRTGDYRKHYPLIKAAVEKGVSLSSAIQIIRDTEEAFTGRTNQAVWQAFRRALLHDNIKLSEIKK